MSGVKFAGSGSRVGAGLKYAVALGVFPFLLLGFCFWAGGQQWFLEHDGNPLFQILGYAQRHPGIACDVVIVGDSSALAAFMPSVIERRTGLKTCNIAEPRFVGEFMGAGYPVDAYLARNPAPRFLVAAWTPTNFNPGHGRMATTDPEDYLYPLLYARESWFWRGLLQKPKPALVFMIWAGNSMVEDTLGRMNGDRARRWRDERARREKDGGRWAVIAPPQTACVHFPDHYAKSTYEQNVAGVAAFRKQYGTSRTEVLVEVTPVADCEPQLREYARLTDGLHENRFEALPIGSFNDRDIHLTDESAARFSEEISEQILARMHGDGAGQRDGKGESGAAR